MEFLKDCQTSFKFLGYCWHDKNVRFSKDQLASLLNISISLFYWYFLGVSIKFFFNKENPYDERIYIIIQSIAFEELHGTHASLTYQRSKITKFFDYFQMVVRQSKK